MRLVAWQADDLLHRLDDVIGVYGAAMGYHADLLQTRRGYVAAHASRPGFRAVATVDDSGNLTGGVPMAAQQVLLLPAFDQVRFSKVTSAEAQQVQQALQAQKKQATGIVPFVGQPVLQGNISELGLDQLLQQAQQQAQQGGKSQ